MINNAPDTAAVGSNVTNTALSDGVQARVLSGGWANRHWAPRQSS